MSGSNTLLATPNHVARIFSLDGARAPKQRHIFVVRFVRGAGNGQRASALTFLVKSVDRPSVQPATEELNQYNKKRQVYTGWKTQPVRIVFFDTADGAAMRMWDEYARHYFGDFEQGNRNGWRYDVTMAEFADNGSGFGFTGANGGNTQPNGHFFFDLIEIVHVGGAGYSKMTLVNPRITAFDPDDLDYENSSPALITATFAYEGLLYTGGAVGDAERALFGQDFNPTNLSGAAGVMPNPLGTPLPFVENWEGGKTLNSTNYLKSIGAGGFGQGVGGGRGSSLGGGILGSFGNFNFGAVAGAVAGSVVSGRGVRAGLREGLPYLASGSPLLSSILTLGGSRTPLSAVGTALLGSFQRPSTGVGAALWDAAQGGVQGGVRGARGATEGAARGAAASVVSGLMSGRLLTGTGSTGAQGVGIQPTATSLAAMNAQRPASAQYGFNEGALTPAQLELRRLNDVIRTEARRGGFL